MSGYAEKYLDDLKAADLPEVKNVLIRGIPQNPSFDAKVGQDIWEMEIGSIEGHAHSLKGSVDKWMVCNICSLHLFYSTTPLVSMWIISISYSLAMDLIPNIHAEI